jgi:hypothetical protein
MNAATHAAEDLGRELAYRANDGLECWLFWRKGDNQLSVKVTDERTCAGFVLNAPRDRALDVFYHPFAYTALLRTVA